MCLAAFRRHVRKTLTLKTGSCVRSPLCFLQSPARVVPHSIGPIFLVTCERYPSVHNKLGSEIYGGTVLKYSAIKFCEGFITTTTTNGSVTEQEVLALHVDPTHSQEDSSQRTLVSLQSQRDQSGCPNPYINLGPCCSTKLKMLKVPGINFRANLGKYD